MSDKPRSGTLRRVDSPEHRSGLQPGEWQEMFTHGKPREDGPTHVMLACPWCGQIASSSQHQHEFHDDGTFTATPSFGCPHAGCGWHVFIKRSAWEAL